MNTYIFSKEIEVKYSVDVLVIGGGTAGTFAAISAAKQGASVLLIEKNGILGGTVTVGGVNFPGLFFAWGKQIIDGPCWESIERTVTLGGATLPEIQYQPKEHFTEQIRLNKAIYAHVLDQMCAESNVQVLLHSMLSYVIETDDGVSALITDKDGLFGVTATCIIDATGDANITHMLGYPTVVSEIQQPATLANVLGGYDFEKLDIARIEQAIGESEELAVFQELTPEKLINYLSRYFLDIHIPVKDAFDSVTKSKLEQDSRQKILQIISALKKIDGLDNIFISYICNECGVRETRRIMGEAEITANDYMEAKRFDDAICYAFYPIDLHVMDGIKQHFLQPEQVPTVPFGALRPKGSKYLLVCGRCIASDALANSAIRVQAVAMATAQAAGCAAAIMSRRTITSSQVEYAELCESLKVLGAIVP